MGLGSISSKLKCILMIGIFCQNTPISRMYLKVTNNSSCLHAWALNELKNFNFVCIKSYKKRPLGYDILLLVSLCTCCNENVMMILYHVPQTIFPFLFSEK